jgi:hypothetical protein
MARHTGQNLGLAIFYWTASLVFDDDGDSLKVQWMRPLDFGFLADLDLQSCFSLRTFLFHRTLTPEEHQEVFRLSDAENTVILESLLNGGLIVPKAEDKTDGPVEPRIEAGMRYHVHPLLLGPVREQLVARRMVY